MAVQHVRSEFHAGGTDGAEAGGEALLLADAGMSKPWHKVFRLYRSTVGCAVPSLKMGYDYRSGFVGTRSMATLPISTILGWNSVPATRLAMAISSLWP